MHYIFSTQPIIAGLRKLQIVTLFIQEKSIVPTKRKSRHHLWLDSKTRFHVITNQAPSISVAFSTARCGVHGNEHYSDSRQLFELGT